MHRRLALLGGTTEIRDFMLAMRYLATPRNLIEGQELFAYERAFAEKIGVRYAYSFCSGRVGLYGLLRVLGVGPGDEVLLQVPTHIVVANAIRYVGARPVYVDCALDTYNMDLNQVEQKITARAKILLLQHTFGIPVDMEKALRLANRHGLIIIEDCVHALGARYDGKMVGSFGKAAFFSTEETKTISTIMGGMVVTDDSDLSKKINAFQESCPSPPAGLTIRYILKLAAYYILTEPYLHRYTRAIYELLGKRHPLPKPTSYPEQIGLRPQDYEKRLSNAQAALGLCQLYQLERNLAHRQTIAKLYAGELSKKGFKVPQPPEKSEPSYVRFPVWVTNRPATEDTLAPHVVAGTWFTSVLEESVCPSRGGYEMGSCPQAEKAAMHLINLPTHPRVKADDAKTILSKLHNL